MAEIVLTRPTGYKSDRLRAYQIHLDRKKVGQIKPDETLAFEVPPGRYELQLKIDWGTSGTLRIDLKEKDQAKFVCAPRVKENDVTVMGGLRQAYWSTFGCRRYIDLRYDDDLVVATEARSWTRNLDGPRLFGFGLVVAIAWWVLTGQSIAVVVVVAAATALVVGGLIGKAIGTAAVQGTQQVQKRHHDE